MDRKIEKKKWTVQRIGLYTIAVAVVGFLFSAIYREAGTSRLNVQSERLLTDTVETGVFKEFITLFGVVEPISTVYLDAIESGRVEEIYIENGAMVSEGQELHRIAGELSQISDATNRAIQRQDRDTEMIATAVSELAASAREIAGSASAAASETEQTASTTRVGKTTTEKSVRATAELLQEIETATEALAHLKNNSDNISRRCGS